MSTSIVSDSINNSNHFELSWEDIMAGKFTTSPARRVFEETVISRAASAKAALPGEGARIDRARDLVLANCVKAQVDGSFVVHSTSERGKSYPVTTEGCTCPDVAKAPEGRCKHLLATWIWRKARSAIIGQPLPPEPPAASNGQSHRVEEAMEESARLAAQAAPGQTIAPQADSQAERPTPQAHSEAPCSINTYLTLAGYRLQVTLRGEDEQQVLARFKKLLAEFPAPEEPPPAQAKPVEPTLPEGWCRRHDLQMTPQHNAKGAWWSHRLADGSWCKGK